MERPDLKESARKRAWKDAELWSLGTLFGALALVAGGALGGSLGALPHFDSAALEVALIVSATVFGALVGFVMFLAIQFYRVKGKQRDELRDYILDRDHKEKLLDDWRTACLKWANGVEKFLEVQGATEPAPPGGDILKTLTGQGPSEDPEQKKLREAIRRQTLSLYIDLYRDEGLRHFNQFDSLGYVNGGSRSRIESPKDLVDIQHAANTIRYGAQQL